MSKTAIDNIAKALYQNSEAEKSFEKAIEKITGQQADDPTAPKFSQEYFKQKMTEVDRMAQPVPFVPTRRTKATVRVMRSFDFCHFESNTTLEGDNVTLAEIDEERKSCQRLCDKAVGQYVKAKESISQKVDNSYERQQLRKEVFEIKQKPAEHWNIIEQAKVKTLDDWDYRDKYDYIDDEQDYRF